MVGQPVTSPLTQEIHSSYAIHVQKTTAASGTFDVSTADLAANPVTAGGASYSFARGFIVDTDGTVSFQPADNSTAVTGFPVVAGVVYPIGVAHLVSHSGGASEVAFLLF
jgi:hypothetical protein